MIEHPPAATGFSRDRQDLQDARPDRSAAAAALNAWSQAAAQTALPAAAELSDAGVVQMVKESR